ncbi:MAG: hypothetical protein OMM_05356 [Candidatus Magnetoglobus multicellularis str. Araruama]|uniref:Carrier domain-containing protein n=1 Tax=Candidatus Magnetoglobus multicellularis str. Araruama TaxID=890399 RepID=A0A1V1NWR1_9BACT|nr:MAG: hypothetical protein OMM_05356 [Candidatus Magnetoglobus multicellularis str. Araruama]
MGNMGQSDYSCANAFMDAYAGYRKALTDKNERHGKTLSVNWPLWKDGGMQIDEALEKMMQQTTGMVPMDTEAGIRAFYQCMDSDQHQVMVMEGRIPQMRLSLYMSEPISQPETLKDLKPDDAQLFEEKAQQYFKNLLSSVIGLPSHRIQADVPMEEYGIDSIMVMELTRELEKVFGSLSKTLFFEYRSITELATHFKSHWGNFQRFWVPVVS